MTSTSPPSGTNLTRIYSSRRARKTRPCRECRERHRRMNFPRVCRGSSSKWSSRASRARSKRWEKTSQDRLNLSICTPSRSPFKTCQISTTTKKKSLQWNSTSRSMDQICRRWRLSPQVMKLSSRSSKGKTPRWSSPSKTSRRSSGRSSLSCRMRRTILSARSLTRSFHQG